MKLRTIILLVACLVAAPMTMKTFGETKTIQQVMKQKASKDARKEAKKLTKEGWKVMAGSLPLEKQLDNMYIKYMVQDDAGRASYIIGTGLSVGGTYDAAKTQAVTNARLDLAGKIESHVTQLIENSISNESTSGNQAASITKLLSESKTLISQHLGRVATPVEIYRQLNNGNYEVQVQMAYSNKEALELAKSSMLQNLGADQEDLKARINGLSND